MNWIIKLPVRQNYEGMRCDKENESYCLEWQSGVHNKQKQKTGMLIAVD